MKKLINEASRVVPEMLEGIVGADASLALLEGHSIVVRRDAADVAAKGDVALISGGGSGHEPAHAGYVGSGMLTAVVAGDVFTSPSTDAVLAAIRAVAGAGGVLLIVKNYTGDRLNFGLAAEIARAEGFAVATVIVDDDVALGEGEGAGRRGLAGTVLVHKVAGAAAAAGLPLSGVRDVADAAIHAVGTMGVALSPCTPPAAGAPSFELAQDEIELGLGIHGEKGQRRSPLMPADALADLMIGTIVSARGLVPGDHVAVLVNNLGATPVMELGIMTRASLRVLAGRGITVDRLYAGTFLTALAMAGCSLSIMKVDDERLRYLDAPTSAQAWPNGPPRSPARTVVVAAQTKPTPPVAIGSTARRAENGPVDLALARVAAALSAAADELTRLDQIVGDGDLGISLSRGAASVAQDLRAVPGLQARARLSRVSAILRRTMGGTSGPLYAAGLLRAASTLPEEFEPSGHDWANAFDAATEAIAELGGAKAGDRTMLDALLPAATALRQALLAGQGPLPSLAMASAAARVGADATAQMLPRLGRSSYLGERAIGHIDPGAQAVVVWLTALAGPDRGR